ncbi:MAG: hypothetical protein K6T66_09420 [Peptococcaceae bacterium]|nr:hypothetical protein [Peptococcaceae bacterium]
MIIEKHYSSRPEDEDYVIRALLLVIKLLDRAGDNPAGRSFLLNDYLSGEGNISPGGSEPKK